MGVPHAMQQGQDDFAGLVGIRGRKNTFLDALTDDHCQQRRALLDNGLIHFLANDDVVVYRFTIICYSMRRSSF
jgi:hypothetical protein